MAIPAGVKTATVTFDHSSSFGGAIATTQVSIKASHNLIWAATGETLLRFLDSARAEDGRPGLIVLPDTEQDGFLDESGSPITGWWYTATVVDTVGAQQITREKRFQIATGVTEVDLDRVPVDGRVGPVGSLPPVPVDSVNGKVGAVTITASDLGAVTEEDVKSALVPLAKTADVTAGLAPKANTADVAKRRYIDNGGVYRPTPYCDLIWRTRRAETLAGTRQGHIAFQGDSRSFGAAATGTTNPKYLSNYPGRLRAALNKKYGSGGTGQVILDYNIRTTPAFDDRFTWGGTITGPGMGFHAAASALLNAAGAGVIDFAAQCEEFWIYNLQASGGLNTVAVDGGTAKTFRNLASTGAAPELPSETGYHPVHIVTKVPAGSLGQHSMHIATNGTHNAVLVAVEGRIPTAGTFRVSNPSISGKSLSTLLANSAAAETSGLLALPMIDMLRADLLLIALGINDWQGASPIATVKTRLTTIIQRQRSVGAAPGGGAMPGGDAALVWLPQPNLATLQPVGGPTWEEYRQAYYEVADEQNCMLIDFGERWKDFTTANGLGLFGDTIHENNKGSLDLAAGMLAPLGL